MHDADNSGTRDESIAKESTKIISGLFNENPWFTKPSRDYLSTILGLFRRETIVNKQSMDYLTNNPRFSKPSIDYL